MEGVLPLILPGNFDWRVWVDRWDRMQERYLARRRERFAMLAKLVRATQRTDAVVLDLGCGPGSTMAALLDALPKSHLIGIDLDPVLLEVGRRRLTAYRDRAAFIQADLRAPDWTEQLPKVDAIISATALHWLSAADLAQLYATLAPLLHPGGIFLNADHLPNPSPLVQRYWEAHREAMRTTEGRQAAEDWTGFWNAFGEAVGSNAMKRRLADLGSYAGQELPLSWHLDQLRVCGFHAVDCFWRCDCDAIYGGIRGD